MPWYQWKARAESCEGVVRVGLRLVSWMSARERKTWRRKGFYEMLVNTRSVRVKENEMNLRGKGL